MPRLRLRSLRVRISTTNVAIKKRNSRHGQYLLLDGQPTTPSRIQITVAGAEDDTVITIVGKRKYGLGKYDLAPVTETVDLMITLGCGTPNGQLFS